ncbi:MAG: BLUF domain-containing protein [Oxalobacteraceae bacterium]|nr:MAG: BLUF domain-containing protein [Oxalobacteraceae bacterium]
MIFPLMSRSPLSAEHEVENILQKGRVNNQRDDITGALVFHSGCIAEVLEGPIARLETAFERIKQEERHGDVSLLAIEPIEARSFPNWAMGFVGASLSRKPPEEIKAAARTLDNLK